MSNSTIIVALTTVYSSTAVLLLSDDHLMFLPFLA